MGAPIETSEQNDEHGRAPHTAPSNSASRLEPPSAGTMKREPCILVVDDDEAFGHELLDVLRKAGYQAHFHRGPFGTLQAVRKTRCDIVMLDINMPPLDGIQLLRMLRNSQGLSDVRAMLCTNMEPRVLARMTSALGVVAVSKSSGTKAILDGVWRALCDQSPATPGSTKRSGR